MVKTALELKRKLRNGDGLKKNGQNPVCAHLKSMAVIQRLVHCSRC